MTDAEILKRNKRLLGEANKFAVVLRKFGFKKLADKNVYGEKMNAYTHDKNEWFADILEHDYFVTVWITGTGLKGTPGYPGGWNYGSVEEIKKEFERAL